MDNWSEFLTEFRGQVSNDPEWPKKQLNIRLSDVSKQLGTNVLLYFSAFLQRPDFYETSMTSEDINGLMNAFHEIDNDKGLAVIMHTPGGELASVEQFTQCINSYFDKVTIIVPAICMSAGSMFALSCDNIIISKIGQLGPTDPQISVPGRGSFSVKDIKQQFDEARTAILDNTQAAHVWAPIISTYGPALYQRASMIEGYAQDRIKEWLKNKGKSKEQIAKIAEVFHNKPSIHAQRIDYDILKDKSMGLEVELLEEHPLLEEKVMEIYHLATIICESSATAKMIIGGGEQSAWFKPLPVIQASPVA